MKYNAIFCYRRPFTKQLKPHTFYYTKNDQSLLFKIFNQVDGCLYSIESKYGNNKCL